MEARLNVKNPEATGFYVVSLLGVQDFRHHLDPVADHDHFHLIASFLSVDIFVLEHLVMAMVLWPHFPDEYKFYHQVPIISTDILCYSFILIKSVTFHYFVVIVKNITVALPYLSSIISPSIAWRTFQTERILRIKLEWRTRRKTT